MTIPLGSYPGPGRAASWRALFALHRTGFGEPPRRRGRWWALTPPFHPYRRRLRRYVGGGLLSVPLSVGFRRLACASVLPCGVRTFLEPLARPAVTRPARRILAVGAARGRRPRAPPRRRAGFRTRGRRRRPARACMTNSPQTRHSSEAPRRSAASSCSSVRASGSTLLRGTHQSSLNTPTTRPRIWTWSA